MNKRQKEVLQSQLESEKVVIKQLEKQYQAALKDINEKVKLFDYDINMLDEAMNQDNLDNAERAKILSQKRSKAYQKQYQEALQKQLEGILEKLHSDEYATLQQYLNESYNDAFLGTMYDLHGQGIPMVMPINQAAAVKAILTDSKISKGLYTSLGVDVNGLKKSISAEITRGIASGLSYNDIARNISNVSNAPLSRAKTIARTEGHRIQQASTMDAQQKAKEKGADVVKQWDSTMDGATRPIHKKLDGQIREIDKPFEEGGKKAQAPGHFGDPAEDCNCRCVSLTRAKWALDEDELNILKDRAEFFGIDKSKNFEDFKKKYLDVVAEESHKNITYKQTVVNPDVKKASYRKKFNKLDESEAVKRKAYSSATAMLEHRSGTKYEDLAFIDSVTGKMMVRTDYNVENEVLPSKAMIEMVRNSPTRTIVAVHNHPGSSVPSITDINTAHKKGYKYGLIACHDGTLMKYEITGQYNEIIVSTLLDRAQDCIYNDNQEKLSKIIKQLENENILLGVFK